jgi:hypothetical protein
MKNQTSTIRQSLAHIRYDSPRAKVWRVVLGSETAPIKSPVTTRVGIRDVDTKECYLLDLDKLDEAQVERLVQHLSSNFATPIDEVRKQLAKDKLVPILAEDVTITFDGRLLW